MLGLFVSVTLFMEHKLMASAYTVKPEPSKFCEDRVVLDNNSAVIELEGSDVVIERVAFI